MDRNSGVMSSVHVHPSPGCCTARLLYAVKFPLVDMQSAMLVQLLVMVFTRVILQLVHSSDQGGGFHQEESSRWWKPGWGD